MNSQMGFKTCASMGWNSYDCFGSSVTEEQVLANARVLARELLPLGYNTVVIDYCWSHPHPGACANPNQGEGWQPFLSIDREHRLHPAPPRFPSSKGGVGFKPLADEIHGMGLQLGLHIMRGFPRQALHPNLPNSRGHLPSQMADPSSTCAWLNHMCGVRHDEMGQAYYDSLFELYASWEIDFIKADDFTFPYHQAEIEMLDRARRKCGRPMVLSLSPGACPLEFAEHVTRHADMWRISPDFWDTWLDLRRAFDLCEAWAPYRKAGGGPDPDMLPLGRLSRNGPAGPERESGFTQAEQRSLLALWSLFGAPLFLGGDLTCVTSSLLDLIRHPALQACRQTRETARCQRPHSELVIWSAPAKGEEGENGVVAGVFNLSEDTWQMAADLFPHAARAVDLWSGQLLELKDVVIAPHDVSLLRLLPSKT